MMPLLLLPLLVLGYGSDNPVQKGDELLSAGDMEGSARAFERAVKKHPDSGMAYTKLGISLVSRERRFEALARFETALKIGGADSVARKLLSRTARELADETLASRPAEARAVLQRAIAASPDDAETHACVALAHTIA